MPLNLYDDPFKAETSWIVTVIYHDVDTVLYHSKCGSRLLRSQMHVM